MRAGIAIYPVPLEQCLARVSSQNVFVEYMEGREGGKEK